MALTVTTTTRTANTYRWGICGQSLAAFGYYESEAFGIKETAVSLLSPANGVELAPYALGGSYASKKNRDNDGETTTSYHCDDTGTLAVSPSVADIRVRMDARAAGNKIQHILWGQGQADALAACGGGALTPAQAAANYYAATMFALDDAAGYLTGCDASPYTIIQINGRTLSDTFDSALGYEQIRQQQLRIKGNHARCISVETYDLELRDSVHPSGTTDFPAQYELGRRWAEALAKHAYAESGLYDGPSVSSVTKLSNTSVQVVITGNGESVSYPSTSGPPPCLFRFGDAATNWDQVFTAETLAAAVQAPTSWSRSGNTLTFNFPNAITGTVQMFFPFNNCPDFDPGLLITGATSEKPLQSYRWKAL